MLNKDWAAHGTRANLPTASRPSRSDPAAEDAKPEVHQMALRLDALGYPSKGPSRDLVYLRFCT
uniref:Uncharacterized protein n=1 Tax=Picea glauca TaxID=3330 RepID=A0A101M1B3_PICGL|nr:hypothetical protein ABT39_MTgene3729 [Picea glauca]QHR87390.1 hypothetical protein Q903MT_gene1400 [Picea sitchensis]